MQRAFGFRTPHQMGLVSFFLLGGVVGPMVILEWQAYVWLKSGLWHALPLRAAAIASGVGVPKVKWVRVQQVIEYIYGCPLSFIVFLTFVTLALLVILEPELPIDQDATPDLP